jgi:hypothetical protein
MFLQTSAGMLVMEQYPRDRDRDLMAGDLLPV